MRIPMVAGNWKMNMTVEGARSLVYTMSAKLREIVGVEKVVCPPFTALLAVQALLEGSDIGLGAQNMFWEEKGAFTGEISPAMLKELCRYVIIGHSERRTLFGETDETANRRVRAAVAADLTPIFCVGETLQEYEDRAHGRGRQAPGQAGSPGLDQGFATRLVVAYEPVWAIGTGKASTAGECRPGHSLRISASARGSLRRPGFRVDTGLVWWLRHIRQRRRVLRLTADRRRPRGRRQSQGRRFRGHHPGCRRIMLLDLMIKRPRARSRRALWSRASHSSSPGAVGKTNSSSPCVSSAGGMAGSSRSGLGKDSSLARIANCSRMGCRSAYIPTIAMPKHCLFPQPSPRSNIDLVSTGTGCPTGIRRLDRDSRVSSRYWGYRSSSELPSRKKRVVAPIQSANSRAATPF